MHFTRELLTEKNYFSETVKTNIRMSAKCILLNKYVPQQNRGEQTRKLPGKNQTES